ncbi:MAG: YlcI/YnfO family protein [Pseudomonadales bacterium]|jgi:predicted transcriptional regulator
MKTTTIPSLRVTPEFRLDAESVLQDGETLSAFVETAVRAQIDRRKVQSEFIARGLAARDAAKTTGQYASKDDVMHSLKSLLNTAKSRVPSASV